MLNSVSLRVAGFICLQVLGAVASAVYAKPIVTLSSEPVEANEPVSLRTAQARQSPNDTSAQEGGRTRLIDELDRIRRNRKSQTAEREPPIPPLPVRRRDQAFETATDPARGQTEPPAGSAAINKIVNQLLIFDFTGTETSDNGVKIVQTLLQQGAIAGVIVQRQNTVSRNQLRDLIKGLVQGKGKQAIIAIRESGSRGDTLTYENGFEPWPTQADVVSKGDPNYAYSTYRTLASNLEFLGITLNIGPKIGSEGGDTYGADPLRNAVFAKTFILGHQEGHISPVPLVDETDVSFRTLKSLLVSDAAISVAAMSPSPGKWPALFNSSLLTGARLCLVDQKSGWDAEMAPSDIKQGCDLFVVSHGGDQATSVRQRIGAAIANAVIRGDLTMERLAGAASRVQAMKLGSPSDAR